MVAAREPGCVWSALACNYAASTRSLASGERLGAQVVVSAADPVTTFSRLVGYRNMETGMARRVSQVRAR